MRQLLSLALACAIGACDRPTAPEAHQIARSVEQKFEAGDFQGLDRLFFDPIGMSVATSIRKNDALTITRNGVTESINGYVMESVVVPPRGVGRPSVRRTLMGWPDDFEFALHATTDGYPLIALADGGREGLTPWRGITVNLRDPAKSWVGLTGEIRIADGAAAADCGTATPREAPIRIGGPATHCHVALYDVEGRGEFVRRGELENSMQPLQQRHQLRIAPQRVPGVRFTIDCPDIAPRIGEHQMQQAACVNVTQFWRDNSLFAPTLGIDVAQFRGSQTGAGWSYRTIAAHSRSGAGVGSMMRWSILRPDGTLIEQGSAGPEDSASRPRVEEWFRRVTLAVEDRRIQALVPARDLGLGTSGYELVVLNIDLDGLP